MVAAKTAPVSHSAKHAFLYLTSFGTLGLVAINIGVLWFQIINFYFPEELSGWDMGMVQEVLKFAIATIFVAAPIYYFVTRIINRHLSKKDLDQDSGVRRWLTYIVMFFAVGTVIGDLIAAMYSFLNGELTIRFFLKVLVILVIAGGIFLYYFTDMKNKTDQTRREKTTRWSMLFWLLVLVPFVWSFLLIENPNVTRSRRIDDQIVSDLSQVRSSIDSFYLAENKLPETIAEITPPQHYLPDLTQLKAHGFSYTKKGLSSYELCAMFEHDTRSDTMQEEYSYYGYDSDQWRHDKGNFCFALEVQNLGDKSL